MKSLNDAGLAIIVISLVTFSTRAFSFLIFSKRKPPDYVVFIEKYIPPMIMVILVVYSLSSVTFTRSPYGLPELISLVFVTIIHVLKNNALLSIFGGTILYMILINL